MILHLNSNYRNRTIYPYSTSFVIPINGTPPPNTFDLDARSILFADQEILFSFIYRSSLHVSYFLFTTTQLLIKGLDIPKEPTLTFFFQNTLVGIEFIDSDTHYSSIIIKSLIQENGILCDLETPLPIDVGTNRSGELKNPSNQFITPLNQTNLLINGFSKYNFAPGMRKLQDDGITTDCWVINLTQQSYYLIQEIIPPFRNVLLTSSQPSTPFQEGDYVIAVSPSFQTNIPLVKILNYYPQGCLSLEVVYSSEYPIKSGTIYSDPQTQLSIEIITDILSFHDWKKSPSILIRNPGYLSDYSPLRLLNSDTSIEIKPIEIGFSFQVDQVPPIVSLTRSRLMFFWLTLKGAIPIYAFVLKIDRRQNRIITEKPNIILMEEKWENYFDILYFIGGFIFLETFFPNLIYPVSNNHLQCYSVELLSLTLPNRPLCGTNLLLANIPYILLQFGNMTSNLEMSTRKINHNLSNSSSLYSNVPSAQNATFVIPIANIRNPNLFQYVVVSSDQVVTVKLNFQEDLQMNIFLPTGELLLFSPIYILQKDKTVLSVPLCPTNYAYNPTQNNLIYIQEEELFVSATFSLELLS